MELVVGASTATMKSVLGKLGSLLAQEYALIRGVRDDIQYIRDELASMQAFLLDISQDGQDNRKKDWMKQIRDMAYDCEDCIDDFAHRLRRDSQFDGKCCTWIYELWTSGIRREIASNITGLKIRAQQIAERRMRYGVDNPNRRRVRNYYEAIEATYDNAENQLPSHQIVDMKEPVGMEKCMEKLENWLIRDDKNRAVLSIVGFGGTGKTTIAKALYRKVMGKFECRASITVSQNYDKGSVLRDILQQVQPQNADQERSPTGSYERKTIVAHITSTLQLAVPLSRCYTQEGTHGTSDTKDIEDQLSNTLATHLTDKSYIILVDDLWSAETWESISSSLPRTGKCSRIIVTSRFQAVGATCSVTAADHVESIDFLRSDDSKKLFNLSIVETYSSNHSNNVQNQALKDLWKRCGGLPLAVVTMAGLVNCNRQKHRSYWDNICKSLPKQENSLTLEGVIRILDFCYNDLPGDLRTCLLYLSIFPKGWKVSRKCLTRRWVTEGFVCEKQGLTEEEVAETYFNQLLKRNLIRAVEHSSNGKLKTFQVHDMVLEYIVSKAREENFITVIGGHWMLPTPSYKVRRLSMQSSNFKHEDSTKGMNLSQVRSLTVFGRQTKLSFEAFNKRLIQVLDLNGWKGLQDQHLTDICKMLVLKYLGLRRTDITNIPSKIENLKYLEILDIRETNVKELPKAVYELKQLNSILGGNKHSRMGLRLPQEKRKNAKKNVSPKEPNTGEGMSPRQKSQDGMKGLHILSGIEIVGESTEIASLHQLTRLRKLAIYNLSVQKDDNSFKELHSAIAYLGTCGLQTLIINDDYSDSDFINSLDSSMPTPPRYLIALELSGNLERPPKWIQNLEKLNKLTLSITVFRTDTLELLCGLPLLFSLTFSLHQGKKKDQKIEAILDKNKSHSGGEIIVPVGFETLKLLRFVSPIVPKMGFLDNAMPSLEMIEMWFETFEGLFGIDTLEKLREVHLRLPALAAQSNESAMVTNLLVDDLKNNNLEVKIIVDHIVMS